MNEIPPDIAHHSLNWMPISQSSLSQSSPWWDWVSDSGSLTKRLKDKSAGDFRVQVNSEEWQSDLPIELRSLFGPVKNKHRFWSRKVSLLGNKVPWVHAHTLIPEHSLMSPLRDVMSLHSKPLGEYLFNHPELIRTEMDVTACYGDTWGRRSLFYLFGKPVLVAEFFLSGLVQK